MPNLKIKIGHVISPASEVVVIKIPKRELVGDRDRFGVLSSGNKISQLIIHQESKEGWCRKEIRDPFSLPDQLYSVNGLRTIWIRGHIFTIPSWIFKEKGLEILGLYGSFKSVPEMLGDLKELSTLDLSFCQNLVSVPSSIGNLTKLTLLNLRECSSLVSLPESIGNLTNLTSLDLNSCHKLESLPQSFGNLSKLISLNLSRCGHFGSLPSSIANLTELRSLGLSEQLISLPLSLQLVKLTSLSFNGCDNVESLPSSIGNYSKLTSLDLIGCSKLESLPESIGNLSNLTSLSLSGCSKLKSFPSSMQNLLYLTNVKLRWCSFERIPSGIEYLKEVTELNLSGCWKLVSLPSSIGNLSNLTSLDCSGCCNLESLPSSIGNLSNLTSLNLRECSKLESLPESIGNLSSLRSLTLNSCSDLKSLPSSIGKLSNLTSLNLSGSNNLTSLPTSIRSLFHLNTPLIIAGIFTLPSDMDWSQFKREVNVVSYVEYMLRMNKISSILEDLQKYMWRFDLKDDYHDIKGYKISTVYGLIKRKEGRGNNLIGYLCLMLTNDWKMKRERGYVNEILEWRNDEKKRDGMHCLKILFMNVCGMEMKREYPYNSTGRRMREVWKEEGKEDSEGRREWERRWREVGDIMNEEDAMETSIMHLCIPDDYEEKRKPRMIIPSGCSYNALSILLNDKPDRECTYHFPVYDINDEPSNVVIIRNLPSGFNLRSRDGNELKSLIENVCPIVSINQAIYNSIFDTQYRVVRVTLGDSEDAVKVATEMDEQLFHTMFLRVSLNPIRPVRIPHTSITSHEKEDMTRFESSGDVLSYPSNADSARGDSCIEVNERETGVKLEYPIRSHGENVGESEWRKSDNEREMRIEYMSNGVIGLNGIGVLVDSGREDVDAILSLKSENEPSIRISDSSKERITVTPETFYHVPRLTTSTLDALENTAPPEDSRTGNSQE